MREKWARKHYWTPYNSSCDKVSNQFYHYWFQLTVHGIPVAGLTSLEDTHATNSFGAKMNKQQQKYEEFCYKKSVKALRIKHLFI